MIVSPALGWPKRPRQERARWALPEPPRLLGQVALLGPAQRVLGGPQVEDTDCLRVPGLLGQVGSYGVDSIVADQARKVGDCVELGQVWYSLVGGSMAELQQQWRRAAAGSDRPMIWTLLAFATTSLVIATAVAVLFRLTGTTGLLPSVGLGLLLWIGFCATQRVGSIMGEDVPATLAAIHAGDWLLHMLIMSVTIGLWR